MLVSDKTWLPESFRLAGLRKWLKYWRKGRTTTSRQEIKGSIPAAFKIFQRLFWLLCDKISFQKSSKYSLGLSFVWFLVGSCLLDLKCYLSKTVVSCRQTLEKHTSRNHNDDAKRNVVIPQFGKVPFWRRMPLSFYNELNLTSCIWRERDVKNVSFFNSEGRGFRPRFFWLFYVVQCLVLYLKTSWDGHGGKLEWWVSWWYRRVRPIVIFHISSNPPIILIIYNLHAYENRFYSVRNANFFILLSEWNPFFQFSLQRTVLFHHRCLYIFLGEQEGEIEEVLTFL